MWVLTVSHPEYYLLLTKNPSNPLLPGFFLLLVKPLNFPFHSMHVSLSRNFFENHNHPAVLCSITEENTAVSLRFPHVFDFWGSIAGFHFHTIKTIQQIKFRVRKNKMNIQTVSQRFRSVRCFVREIFEAMFSLIYKALYGDAMLLSLRKEQIWRPEAKTCVIELYYKKGCSCLLRTPKHLHEYLFAYKDCSDCKISADKSLFNLRDILLGLRFNNVSRKSIEIKLCFVTTRKTLSN